MRASRLYRRTLLKWAGFCMVLVIALGGVTLGWIATFAERDATSCIQDSAQARTQPTVDFANNLLQLETSGPRNHTPKQVARERHDLIVATRRWRDRLIATQPGNC